MLRFRFIVPIFFCPFQNLLFYCALPFLHVFTLHSSDKSTDAPLSLQQPPQFFFVGSSNHDLTLKLLLEGGFNLLSPLETCYSALA